MKSLDRIEAGTEIVELIIRSMHDEEANPQVFELLRETFSALAGATREEAVAPIQFRFYLQFCRISGFEIKLREEDPLPPTTDKRFARETIFQLTSGEMKDYLVEMEDRYSPRFQGVRVAAESRAALEYLDRSSIEKASGLRITDRTRTELVDLFNAYFTQHLPGFTSRTMKSGRVFSSLDGPQK
jgi:recombinational DNA repair protein (RecF pathway)